MSGTSEANFDFSLSDRVISRIGKRAWIDGMLVVEAAADSVSFSDLVAHDC